MDLQTLSQQSVSALNTAQDLIEQIKQFNGMIKVLANQKVHGNLDPIVICLMVFVLACFIGYYVVWKVTPALHSPLMAVTNAISSVIIVGAIIAAGSVVGSSGFMGFMGVLLASVNIFGGFVVTQRMLQMFSKKNRN